MNQSQPDRLDDVLRQWAVERSADEEHMQQLGDHIGQVLREDTFRLLDEQAVEHKLAVRRRIALAVVGTAALLLTAVAGVAWLSWPDRQQIAPEFAWLTAQQVQNKQILWTEFDRTFDQRLTWIAETSNQVEIGLAEDGVPAPRDSRPVAVRVVVARRTAGQAWQPVWAVDVISRTDQLVHLPREGSKAVDLAMRAHLLPDGRVAVDTTLEIDNQQMHSARSSNVHQDLKPTMVFSQQADGVEYQVFQTVALLKDGVG
jgi:hypothetical protein